MTLEEKNISLGRADKSLKGFISCICMLKYMEKVWLEMPLWAPPVGRLRTEGTPYVGPSLPASKPETGHDYIQLKACN
jgi:hypothetical protein